MAQRRLRYSGLLLLPLVLLFTLGAGPTGAAAEPLCQVTPYSENLRAEVLAEMLPEDAPILATWEGRAARFLYRNISPVAFPQLAPLLTDILDTARTARDYPWCAGLSEELFFREVLAPLTAQEPLVAHRARLAAELAPLVRRMLGQGDDGSRLAVELARWCHARVAYVPTSRRDLDPLSILARGEGRCEEAVILFCAAARSVGLPARLATVPSWRHQNDNHAWAEVYVNGTWQLLDPANPSEALDRAWFAPGLAKAPAVLATSFGPPLPDTSENVRSGDGFTVTNRTAVYARTAPVSATVSANGEPVAQATVFLSVYNYGSLRPVGRIVTDEAGRGSIRLGLGTYVASAATAAGRDLALVRVTEEGGALELQLAETPLPSGNFLQTFHADAGERALPRETPTPAFSRWKADQVRIHQARRELLKGAAERFVARHPELADIDGLAEKLQAAGARMPTYLEAFETVLAHEPETAQSMARLLAELTPKDAVQAGPDDLLKLVEATNRAREGYAKAVLGLMYDEATYRDFVLQPRVSRYEPFSAWRPELVSLCPELPSGLGLLPQGGERVREIGRRVAELSARFAGPEDLGKYLFMPMPTPFTALALAMAPTPLSRAVTACALLRALGIPARVPDPLPLVQFYDGTTWVAFDPAVPASPDSQDDPAASPLLARRQAAPATLRLTFTRGGKMLSSKGFDYFQDFGLSRMNLPEDGLSVVPGAFTLLEPGQELQFSYDEAAREFTASLPPGEYYLAAATRDAQGQALVRLVPFVLTPGSTTTHTMQLDADAAQAGPLSLPSGIE